LFVGQEHEHIAIARVEGRVLFVDRHPSPELARYAPGPGNAVAEAVDEGIDYVGVIDAPVVGTVDGAQLAGVAVPSYQDADVLDAAGEAQVVVEAVRDHRGRHAGLAKEARREITGTREAAQLPKRPMRHRRAGQVVATVAGERQPGFLGIIFGNRSERQATTADDLRPRVFPDTA